MKNTNGMRHSGRKIAFLGIVCVAIISFFTLTLFGNPSAHAATTIYNVKNFGATGNGKTKDTISIQNAINAANKTGGIVEFPAGNYLTAPLLLKSNVTLQVDTGATLLGSQTVSDYTVPSGVSVVTKVLALINSNGANNIGITGGGVIDGQGASWWASGLAAGSRPRLIELAHGTTISVSNVSLLNAGAMHLFLSFDSGVTVNNVTIKSPATSPNTDGIDPATSHNVTISNCSIDTGDDNIAIKSGSVDPNFPNAGTSNITIKDSTFLHGHGVSIGSEVNGGVQNVSVSNSTFNGTTNGIRIKTDRTVGGDVSGITYTNLTMTNVTHPLIFTGYYPKIPTTFTKQAITATTPFFHNVTVTNLVATGASDAGDIVGVPEKPFTGITLSAVKITAKTGLVVANAAVTTTNGTKITPSSGSAYIIESGGSVTAK